MTKKVTCLSGLILLFSFYSYLSFGQCWRVYYCDGCVRNGLCPKYQDYNTKEEAEASAKLACPAATPDVRQVSNCGSTPAPRPVNLKSPGANGFYGALLGGLVGFAARDPNGKELWDLGVTGGFAAFSIITTIAVPKGRPMGPSITLGAINGFCLGYAVGRSIPLISKTDTPKPPEEVTKTALITGGVGLAGSVIIGAIKARPGKTSSISHLIRKSKILSKTAFTFSTNRVGIVIRL